MDQPLPTTRQIQTFITIAETLSFHCAAKVLTASQSTVTAQIIALEKALGLQLLERSRAGTVMTTVGLDLLQNARRILEEFDGMIGPTESVSRGPGGTYRLGVTPTLGPYLMPHILPELHKR